MNLFINFSNHPSKTWSKEQIEQAEKYGEIYDIPFPNVSPFFGEEDINILAEEMVQRMLSLNPTTVLCQGEFTLSYLVVKQLKEKGITVLAACSERNVVETENSKTSVYNFVRFRKY